MYDEGKLTECTKLGLSNLSDPEMLRYLQIKTLVLLVGAENDSWEEAEVCVYLIVSEKLQLIETCRSTEFVLNGRTPPQRYS